MKFGPVPTCEALGAVLAHSVPLHKGRLRKGHVLSAGDLDALHAAGRTEITVAQYEPDDVNEDDAAARLAAAIAGPGLRLSKAATGRVNIFATGPGIVAIDSAAVQACNSVNPMITVATLPPLSRLAADVMVATIKIISYAVPLQDVERACLVAEHALRLLPPVYQTATLIETLIDQSYADKGRRALAGRLDRLDMALTPAVTVPHALDPLVGALRSAPGDVIFVLTGSATSDINDLGPAALREAGGTVTQFGMPVDPGNLLFLGFLQDKPVIGLPGCARSPALNGADWVLERVICGVPPGPADFAKMGVGGLLKEIPLRPKPRAEI